MDCANQQLKEDDPVMRDKTPTTQVGWRVHEFMAALGLATSTFYQLDPKPPSILIGTARVILESPADYAARVGALSAEQAAATNEAEAKAKRLAAVRKAKRKARTLAPREQ